VPPLPFADASFTIVTARYAFHHLAEPGAVLAEMTRVCAPGGRVLVCDVAAPEDPRAAEAFDRMERLRDPSHVRALGVGELRAGFARVGLGEPRTAFYRLEFELERLLQGSGTEASAAAQVRAQVQQSLGDGSLESNLRRAGEVIQVSYPIMALCARKSFAHCKRRGP
jgi:SAM-dependent methyltransferase